MLSLPSLQFCRDEKSCLTLCAILLVLYFCTMDVIMYFTFMNINLMDSVKIAKDDEIFSPFSHLSVKAIMNDPTSQYIVAPISEWFDAVTHFSTVFYFITPNMISFTHLFLAFVAARFISSESLHTRRIGVLIYEVRTWLDAMDGVVYRSQSHTKGIYQSVHASTGYYVDIFCDGMGGVFLCFGVLFYLFKRFDPTKQSDVSWKSLEAGNGGSGKNGANGHHHHAANGHVTYSKKILFWKCWCYGISIALGGKFWDSVVADFSELFQKPLADPTLSALQFDLSHSSLTIFIWYFWRLFEGQALLQYILVAVFIDKVIEFLNFVQYLFLVIIVSLYTVTLLYVRYLHNVLHV